MHHGKLHFAKSLAITRKPFGTSIALFSAVRSSGLSTWAPIQPAREGSRNAGLTVIHSLGFTYDWIYAIDWNTKSAACITPHSRLFSCAGFSA
jgi:hypothetical protein